LVSLGAAHQSHQAAARSLATTLPTNSQFFRPSATSRINCTTRLLSIGIRPSVAYRFNASQCLRMHRSASAVSDVGSTIWSVSVSMYALITRRIVTACSWRCPVLAEVSRPCSRAFTSHSPWIMSNNSPRCGFFALTS
jgi:hypothetical protein